MEHLHQEPADQTNHGALVPVDKPAVAAVHAEVSPYARTSADEQERGGLIENWFILRRHKGTVIVIAFLGALIGYLTTLPETPIYQAHTSLEIENLNENFLNIKEVNPTQTGTSSQGADIQTQIMILQSESLIERVVAKLKTGGMPKTDTGRISAWKKALNLPEVAPQDAYQTSIATAAGGLKVRATGQTRIVSITVDSTDPNTAALFANTLTNEYIEQNLESRWKTTEKTTEWLTRQLDDMRVKLERSDDRLQQYARQAGLIFTNEKTNVSEEKLHQLQTALSTAQADRVAKQSRFEMANSSPPEALPDILGDDSIRDYQAKLTELRRQIAELTATYTMDYPKVKRAQAQYAVIEAEYNRSRAAILRKIRNEFEEATRRERLFAEDYSNQAKLVSGEGERGIQYNILKREVDSNRQLYDTMLSQLKQATIASALRASNIRVVDPAKAPRRPYKPSGERSAITGLIAGFLVAGAFVILRDRADRSIQQPGDAAYYLKIPELGVIPAVNVAGRRQIGSSDGDGRVELMTWSQKPSVVAEAFRSTLISILFSSQNGSRPRVIVLTSAGPAEGKSTLVTNLGIAIAEVGQKVLLIDADLRKPRLHTIFGFEPSPGLTNFLAHSDSTNGSRGIAQAIRDTPISGLSVLPSGKSTSAATSLLYGPRMAEILNEFRREFDTILIDTPPMLQIPDARVLARLADKVILVVRSGKTTRDAALAASQKFKEDGTHILGTILNGWNPKQSPGGYYGYYTGYYNDYQRHYHVPQG